MGLRADTFCADSCSVVLVGRAVRRLRVGRAAAQDARDPAEVRVGARARVGLGLRVRVGVRVEVRVSRTCPGARSVPSIGGGPLGMVSGLRAQPAERPPKPWARES